MDEIDSTDRPTPEPSPEPSPKPALKPTSEDDGQERVSEGAKGDWGAAGKCFWGTCWKC